MTGAAGAGGDPRWRLRTFEAGDEGGLVALLESGFGRPIDPGAWRWKLRARPAPAENVWLAVEDTGRPVFQYAGIPRRLLAGGETFDVMVAVDGVTHPSFRRRGLLTSGVKEAHRAWAAAGVAAVLGLPNEQWGSRVAALGWLPLFPLRWKIRPLRPEKLLARRPGLAFLGRWSFLGRGWNLLWPPGRRRDPAIEIAGGEAAWRILEEQRAPGAEGGEPSLERGPEWIAWRYRECPLHAYRALAACRAGRLVGYLVYRLDSERRWAYVAEVAGSDREARGALLAAAVRTLLADGAAAVATLTVPGSELSRSLRRAGFLWSWGAFPVHCVPLCDDFPLELLRGSRSGWLCGGDFDVV